MSKIGVKMIAIERIYNISETITANSAVNNKRFRILVDRLWPRGLRKEKAKVDLWLGEIGPSNDLRKWFGHDPARWSEFKDRYFHELDNKEELVKVIVDKARQGDVILLYGARDEEHNNAMALKEYIDAWMKSGR
jgi:uncharacterized protein YeaO (DUF488 family)